MRHRNVAKLLYIHMLGYPSHWGQMEALKLIASPGFPEKRMGYLTLMLLLTEKEEVLMLATNSMNNDLMHSNSHIAGLALTALGNLATTEMARDVASNVEKLLRSSNPYLRKKACLCAVRVLERVPELLEDFTDALVSTLKDRHHGVLNAGLQCMVRLLEAHPEEAAAAFRPLVPAAIRMLRHLLAAGFEPEHTIAGITDPFLQVKLLRVLCLLGRRSEEAQEAMNDILAQTATHTETAKNAGNAILYECVQTILRTEAEAGLRMLAVNILGRFLQNRDNNIRYVGLNTLSRIAQDDLPAVQRHRAVIVDCLKDADATLRARALELVLQIVDRATVEPLAGELLNYLVVAPQAAKADLCSRIVEVVDKFAPTPKWRVECLLTMLSVAGNHCTPQIVNITIMYICQVEALAANVAHKLFRALRADLSQLALVHVGLWCLGEHGDRLLAPCPAADADSVAYEAREASEIVDLCEKVAKLHSATPLTRAYLLNALVKLSVRLGGSGAEGARRLEALVAAYSESMTVELQQRACEYLLLLQPGWEAVRAEAIARMPPPDPEALKKRRAQFDPSEPSASEAGDRSDPDTEGGGLLGAGKANDFANDFASLGLAPAPAGPSVAGNGGDNLINLDDLFGGGPASAPAPAPAAAAVTTPDPFGPGAAAAAAPAPAPAQSDADLLADIFSSVPAPTLAPAGPPPPPQAPAAPQGGAAPPLAGPNGAPMPPQTFGGPPGPAPAPAPAVPQPTSMTVFEKNGLSVALELSKPDPGQPGTTQAVARFLNATSTPMDRLVFQAAVPKYIRLEMRPPSSNSIPANRGGSVTQTMILHNSMHGQKNLMIKLKLQLSVGAKGMDELIQVSSFPDNF